MCYLHRTTLTGTVKKCCDCLVPYCYLFDGGFLSASPHLFASSIMDLHLTHHGLNFAWVGSTIHEELALIVTLTVKTYFLM